MKMYIANCTNQVREFTYRIPEYREYRKQRIEIGAQIQISGDLTENVIDYIVSQNIKYGLVRVDEVDRTKNFIGVCWDTKPIPVSRIKYAIEANQQILVQRGVEQRKEAALMVHDILEQQPGGKNLTNIDFQIDEEDSKDTQHEMEHSEFSEAIRVTRKEEPSAPPVREGRIRGKVK